MIPTPYVSRSPWQNTLLETLSPALQKRLLPHLELYPMRLGEVIHDCGQEQRYVYFPTESIISRQNMMLNGSSPEVSVIGNEGLLGVGLFMGGETTTSRAVVRNAGISYRLPGRILMNEFMHNNELELLMLRYTQSVITQIAQIAACNRHHALNQQLCRWLLMTLDRLPDNTMFVTQELIASLLGVRREGITQAAGNLQNLEIIKYSRGRITVLDRQRLEEMSCECYQVVKIETDRLLFHPPKRCGHPIQAQLFR